MGCFFFPKTLLLCAVLCSFGIVEINSQHAENTLTPAEIQILLEPLLALPGQRTLQAQVLRQQLIKLIEEGLDEVGPDNDDALTKRNLQSLARSGYLNVPRDATEDELIDEAKRGIASLARNGELHHTKREEIEDLLEEIYNKRNIASLARDYNFPSDGKRFLGSLARNGDLNFVTGKRNIASIMRNGKRNLASLVRNNNMPFTSEEDKRSIASLARNGGRFLDKRNVAALLRQDNYLNHKHEEVDDSDDNNSHTEKPEETNGNNNDGLKADNLKRNLASVKAAYKQKYKRSARLRNKRQVDYYDIQNEEYPQPVYQKQNAMDYEDYVRALSEMYPSAEKRFLGSVARSGWPSSLTKYRADKRHIASLARLGWLPSFRSVRRFNRSGRSSSYDACSVCREVTANGQTEDYTPSKVAEKEHKQYLLIPTNDRVLYRRFPIGPRNIQ